MAMVYSQDGKDVSPYIGEWIEITALSACAFADNVSPYIGEWIEIIFDYRTLKSNNVSPYIGEWIEILILSSNSSL